VQNAGEATDDDEIYFSVAEPLEQLVQVCHWFRCPLQQAR
jgi:hypothetical protein